MQCHNIADFMSAATRHPQQPGRIEVFFKPALLKDRTLVAIFLTAYHAGTIMANLVIISAEGRASAQAKADAIGHWTVWGQVLPSLEGLTVPNKNGAIDALGEIVRQMGRHFSTMWQDPLNDREELFGRRCALTLPFDNGGPALVPLALEQAGYASNYPRGAGSFGFTDPQLANDRSYAVMRGARERTLKADQQPDPPPFGEI